MNWLKYETDWLQMRPKCTIKDTSFRFFFKIASMHQDSTIKFKFISLNAPSSNEIINAHHAII